MASAEPAWPVAVLFDLDGTLIDSVPDLAASVNILLAENGFAPLSLDEVKSMVGHGLPKLVERAFAARGLRPGPDELAAQCDRMVSIYDDHLTVLTTPMSGAGEVLERLHGRGMRLAVVTNKPQRAAETILERLGLARFIETVVGGTDGMPKKPAPDMVLAAMKTCRATPESTVLVGDSAADVQSAHAAGIAAIVVEGGYTKGPAADLGADRLIASLNELDEVLGTFATGAGVA
ncbi:phosphoglycolate phosphatase [Mesorhizobium xinjiangense]|uniref:phosphoglycolate phosphatase n=1 Tax=Mesorhizobium xinjiangense TaxID=2678685 RepID=UPI0012EEB7BE|nr:phosphoglycolate phosphatase [Mesorhizobium xinjiangense]